MTKGSDKHDVVNVEPHDDDRAVKRSTQSASGVFDRRAEAIDRAEEIAGRRAVIVHGREGKIRKLTPFD